MSLLIGTALGRAPVAFKFPLPPSTSPCSRRLQPGVLLAGAGLAGLHLAADLGAVTGRGSTRLASALRAASLEQLGDETFAEYYQPVTGAPLGSLHQSWTAAVALDWLLDEE